MCFISQVGRRTVVHTTEYMITLVGEGGRAVRSAIFLSCTWYGGCVVCSTGVEKMDVPIASQLFSPNPQLLPHNDCPASQLLPHNYGMHCPTTAVAVRVVGTDVLRY